MSFLPIPSHCEPWGEKINANFGRVAFRMADGNARTFLTQEKPFKLSTKFTHRSGSQGDSFRLVGTTSGGSGADVSQREALEGRN